MLKALIAMFIFAVASSAFAQSNEPDMYICGRSSMESIEDTLDIVIDALPNGSGDLKPEAVVRYLIDGLQRIMTSCAGRSMRSSSYDSEKGGTVILWEDKYIVEAVTTRDITIRMEPTNDKCDEIELTIESVTGQERNWELIQAPDDCGFTVFVESPRDDWELYFYRLSLTLPALN